jgi:hypothetical protein
MRQRAAILLCGRVDRAASYGRDFVDVCQDRHWSPARAYESLGLLPSRYSPPNWDDVAEAAADYWIKRQDAHRPSLQRRAGASVW